MLDRSIECEEEEEEEEREERDDESPSTFVESKEED